ncbi:MAG: amidohydrolase family protein [Myxococcota bacterium]
MELRRRDFVRLLLAVGAGALPGCGRSDRYDEQDAASLREQKQRERERSGRGPLGPQRYRGYRGLAELPWFELDEQGRLRCVAEDLPPAIDVHAHLGIALLFAPELDLQARTPRVQHLLDCDRDGGCTLDLDVYINANFSEAGLAELRRETTAQLLWGSRAATTHTIPNLIDEMDACRVGQAVLHPITFGLPLGDDLNERWHEAVTASGLGERLILGTSVHPRDDARIEKLRRAAAGGARIVKLHPAMQRFFPDDPEAMDVYAECEKLGLVVFFHAGRAGIEPERLHPYTMLRNYEPMLERFPEVDFVFGHAGARDGVDAVELAARHANVWMDLHGQGVTVIAEMVDRLGGDQLLYGTDWPWYPLAVTLAKVLLVTDGRTDVRDAILRGNAERLLGLTSR